MPIAPFAELFKTATGGHQPYPFQEQFATRRDIPQLLRVPTGAGKTATAIIGWLYRRQTWPQETPRRLVYCLPMRVLVEQSEREARRWIGNLGCDVPVHVLMGGVESEQWYLQPEQPTILIGTQDMLLSRALNRGYSASRFHWPIDFGLLNNDCLWVFDEPQLMGSGVSTSAQLAGLRAALGTAATCPSVWMSATLEPAWLETVDFQSLFSSDNATTEKLGPIELTDADFDPSRPLYQRMTAEKTLQSLGVSSTKDMRDVARAILRPDDHPAVHQPGTQTLIVINTVDRAKALYHELQKLRKQSATPSLLLVHSRFRPLERRQLNEQLQEPGNDRIIVATQVVEAGVDISARTLVTELAPWSSLVQRMGRCNRAGTDGPGLVYWIELDEKLSPPYTAADLDFARNQLQKLTNDSVSPRDLDRFKAQQNITLPFEHKHVLRRRDLLDLFDTTPDLSGNDIDVQRYVRGDDPDTDVQVFWRAIGDGAPGVSEPAPHRDELCNVPLGQARDFLDSRKGERQVVGYVWDHLDEQWNRVDPRQLRPGMTVLLSTDAGGYDWSDTTRSGKGWSADGTSPIEAFTGDDIWEEGEGSDVNSALQGRALTIAEHTANVCRELAELLTSLGVNEPWRELLLRAAQWHDVGKAHPAFQSGMHRANSLLPHEQLWAKSGKRGRLKHGRKFFRHELASALAALQNDLPFPVAYLVASHHGRARLAIRSLPNEDQPDDSNTLFALGVHHGDRLPTVSIDGQDCPALSLDLTPMQLGSARSWTANSLNLLAEHGPFRLAFFESLLRAADVRTSQKEATGGT